MMSTVVNKTISGDDWLGANEEVELDIDLRIIQVWSAFWATDEWGIESVAAFLRWAYGQGYHDCLSEATRGKLFRDHGYPIPRRSNSEDS